MIAIAVVASFGFGALFGLAGMIACAIDQPRMMLETLSHTRERRRRFWRDEALFAALLLICIVALVLAASHSV